MHTCKKCRTPVATGRNYCDAHYNEAMMIYHEQLLQYEQDLQYWESLSDEEKSHYHREAEKSNVTFYAVCVGIIIGGLIWYMASSNIDNLVGLIIMGLSIFITSGIRPIRVFIGRSARAILKGVFIFLVIALLTAFLGEFSDFVKSYTEPYFQEILLFEFFGSILLAMVFEITGQHHASGAPCPPEQPRP